MIQQAARATPVDADAVCLAIGQIVLDESDIDRSILESGVAGDLPLEAQRAAAAKVMISLSFAAAYADEQDYSHWLGQLQALSAPPGSPQEVAFEQDYLASVVAGLRADLGEDQDETTQVFLRRAGALGRACRACS